MAACFIYFVTVSAGALYEIRSPSAFGESVTLARDAATLSLLVGNNLGVAVFLMTGVVTFGVSTVLVLAWNGFQVGQAVAHLLAENGSGVWVLLPHALTESIGLTLAAAVGLFPIALLIRRLRVEASDDAGSNVIPAGDVASVRPLVHLACLAVVAALVVFLAALIETYMAPELMALDRG